MKIAALVLILSLSYGILSVEAVKDYSTFEGKRLKQIIHDNTYVIDKNNIPEGCKGSIECSTWLCSDMDECIGVTCKISEDRCFLGNNRYQFKMAEPTVFYKNIISDDVDFISYVKSSLIGGGEETEDPIDDEEEEGEGGAEDDDEEDEESGIVVTGVDITCKNGKKCYIKFNVIDGDGKFQKADSFQICHNDNCNKAKYNKIKKFYSLKIKPGKVDERVIGEWIGVGKFGGDEISGTLEVFFLKR